VAGFCGYDSKPFGPIKGGTFLTSRLSGSQGGERSWTYLQVLFGSLFCLTNILNMAMVRNFEVMFLINAVQLCV
jgi:hypothetical protein